MTQPDLHPIIQKQAFRYLYLISKVRGPKVMVRWFPHEVKDFEPVLVALQQQDPHDCEVSYPSSYHTLFEHGVHCLDVGNSVYPTAVAIVPTDDSL